jgi:hypothetical protein
MITIEMTEESKEMLLKEIQDIQSDVWDLKISTVADLDYRINKIDSRLDTFINDLEMELIECEE